MQTLKNKLMSGIWLIDTERLAAVISQAELRVKAGMELTAADAQSSVSGRIAVIGIQGVITYKYGFDTMFMGGTSALGIKSQIGQAIKDKSITSIILDIDSPGGSVFGIQELADYIRAAKKEKPIYAISNPTMASAAYWIGSNATSVSAVPSGEVGSVGVVVATADYSQMLENEGIKVNIIKSGEYKWEGNPYEPLSEEGRNYLQSQTDSIYEKFIGSVAKGRGVETSKVKSDFGNGRMLLAGDAYNSGMIDAVETLPELIARASAGLANNRFRAVAETYKRKLKLTN